MALKDGGPPIFKPITIPYKGEKERYYSYCATHRIAKFGQQRLVINYSQADLSGRPVFYISNRLTWQAPGITRIRRHRWPVEVYHEVVAGPHDAASACPLCGLTAQGNEQ